MAIEPLQLPPLINVPQFDSSPLAKLGEIYKNAQNERLLSNLGANFAQGNMDYRQAGALALQAGRPDVAQALLKLQESKENLAATREQHAATLAEAIRSHRASEDLQRQGLEGKPQDHIIKDANDNPQIVRVYPDNRPPQVMTPPAIAGTAPNNPFSYGTQNENQSKDSGYANRMFRAEGVFRDPKVISAAGDLTQRTIDKAPVIGSSGKLGLGNYIQSDDYQRYDQASRDFINAVLRRESGAAINQSEFDNAYKQYLPRPGDSSKVLADKQRNRQEAIAGVAGGGGKNYKPPFTFGPSGELVRTQAPMPGVSAAKAENDPAPVSAAREAIARGADPQAVADRLRKNGIKFNPQDLELK